MRHTNRKVRIFLDFYAFSPSSTSQSSLCLEVRLGGCRHSPVDVDVTDPTGSAAPELAVTLKKQGAALPVATHFGGTFGRSDVATAMRELSAGQTASSMRLWRLSNVLLRWTSQSSPGTGDCSLGALLLTTL
jgi:hypothetical protein